MDTKRIGELLGEEEGLKVKIETLKSLLRRPMPGSISFLMQEDDRNVVRITRNEKGRLYAGMWAAVETELDLLKADLDQIPKQIADVVAKHSGQ